MNQFILPEEGKKVYFDMGDTYGFAKMVSRYPGKNIDYFAPREWPFFLNFWYHAYPKQINWE
jgi:hypothetical protein